MRAVRCMVVGLAMSLFAGPVSAVVLTPDDSRIGYSDYARVTVNSSMARFDRIIAQGNNSQHDNPGARVRFRTDATSATATVSYNSLHKHPYVNSVGTILVDGVQTGTFTAGSARGAVSIPVLTQGSAAYHTVELVMPDFDSVDFAGLTVNAGAGFAAVPARPSTRWVAYGDSITQGAYATTINKTFVGKVAQTKGWEVVNMGFGSDVIDGADGNTIGTLGAGIISEMQGYNNAAGGTPAATFKASMATFVSNVRSHQASVPIYLISPLYSPNNASLLAQYRSALQDLADGVGRRQPALY